MNESDVKHFFLSISSDTTMKIKFDVENPQNKTSDDIKQQIQNEFGIPMDQFNLNIDKNKKISKITDKIIIVDFKNKCKDIHFILPDEKKVTIEKSYELNFQNLILGFNKKGFYFSDKCSNNINFKIWNFKISQKSLKLDFIPEGKELQVINQKMISIDFENKSFYFESGEFISKAEEFIKAKLRGKLANIHSCNPKIKSKIFMQGEKYSTKLSCKYAFIDPNGKQVYHALDSDATVGDAKNLFAILYCDKGELKATDIKIFDESKEITDNKMLLKRFKNLQFDIVIKGTVNSKAAAKSKNAPTTNPSKTATDTAKKTSKAPIKSNSKQPLKQTNDGDTAPGKQAETALKAPSKPPVLTTKTTAKPTPTAPEPSKKPSTPKYTSKITPAPKRPSSSKQPQPPKAAPVVPSIKPPPKEEEKTEEKKKQKPKKSIKVLISEVNDDDDDNDDENSQSSSSSGEKVEINFIFEESVGRTIDPVKINVGLGETIEKVRQKIGKKYNIPNLVEIKYRDGDEKITVDKDMTIEDIKDDMIQKNESRSKNVLYVGSRVQKKLSKPKKSYKPTISSIEEDKKPQRVDLFAVDHYIFSFDEEEKDILLKKESLLIEHANIIKKKFGIDINEEIGFKLVNQENNEEDEIIEDLNQKMKNFDDQILLVYLKDEDAASIYLTQNRMNAKNAEISTYYYMTNLDDEKHSVDLDSKATVKSIKRHIKREGLYEVSSLSNIKVLFAGKDLLDNLVLSKLEIGDALLYVYIRSIDDILLMTAKALRVDDNYDDYSD